MLSLSTFGALRATWNGKPIAGLGSGKPAALLVFLALEPGMHPREKLADLFWPGGPAESARRSLRQALFLLRGVLTDATGHAVLISGRHHAGFDTDLPFLADAVKFATPLADCAKLAPLQRNACLAQLADLAGLYRGQFLSGFALPDCADFEDWLQVKREQLHRRALDLLAYLAEAHEQRGDLGSALPFALRYSDLEPWSEDGYLRSMRLYALNGQRDAALGQFEACRRVLERELGVLPGAQLRAQAERVRKGEFGASLSGAVPEIRADEGRHPVSVLYCELEPLGIDDPEEAMEQLRQPQARCEMIAQKFSGHIVQVHGGGLLVYFGYPQALENTALYAVRAARMMAGEATPGLGIRLGVHSGLIVIAGHSRIPDPIGMTSNIAIQLRWHAGSGEVLVSAQAQQRLAGYFHFSDMGTLKLRGLPQAQHAFKVTNETGATHRLAAATRLTPFSGRETELARLMQAWTKARQGEFQAILVSGEAGIGKSRLVNSLTAHFLNDSGPPCELRCFPETMQTFLHPVIALCEALCGFTPADGVEARQTKLEQLLQSRAPQLAQHGLPLLTRMLELPGEITHPLPELSPEQLKAAIFTLLIDLLHVAAASKPVLLVAEDMHWADASTLELLATMLARGADVPVLLLMTARSEWTPGWPGLNEMALAPLPDADIATMVDHLCGGIAPARLADILARADGIPLFAEELAMTREDKLPGNLRDLLAIRLDKLGPARAVAQSAATIGNEFELDMLGRICDLPADELRVIIGRLEDSGLMQALPNQRLKFKHALVREAAYDSQARNVRRLAHQRIARLLQGGYRGIAEHQPELLAQHLGAAGETAAAVEWWLTAGRRAAGSYAHREAVSHYDTALVALAGMPPGMEKDRLECALLMGLARSEQEVAGYGQGRSGDALDRTIALLEQGVGNATDTFNALWGLWEGAGSRAGHEEGVRLAHRLLGIAKWERVPALLQQAHYALGNSLFWTGDLASAHEHLAASITLDAVNREAPTRDCYGRIILVAAQAYLSWVLWQQGQTAQSRGASTAAIAYARQHRDPNALAFALTFAAILQRWQGEVEESRNLAAEGKAVSVGCRNVVFETVNEITLGWAAVMRGDAAAIEAIERSVNTIRQAMSGAAVPVLMPLAEALLHLGEFEKAKIIVEEALEQSRLKQDRHCLAELHRLAGLCLSVK